MGCGASSSNGSAPSVPAPDAAKPGTGVQPTSPKVSDVPASREGAASGGVSRAGSGKDPQPQPQPQRSSGSYSKKQAPSPSPSPPAPPPPAADKEPAAAAPPPARASSGPPVTETPKSPSQSRLPPLPAGSASKLQAPVEPSARPALQIPRTAAGGALSCLAPPPLLTPQTPPGSDLPAGAAESIQQLSSGGAGQAAAAAQLRQLLCTARPPVQTLLDKGAAAALVRCLREGPPEAKVDAAWALTNIASSPVYSHVEALCTAQAPSALLVAMGATPGRGARTVSKSGAALAPMLAAAGAGGGGGSRPGSAGAGAATASGAGGSPLAKVPEPLREQALWALANIAGALHPDFKTQALAAEVLDAGALGPVLAVIEAEGASAASGPASPTLRCAAWCLHNLAKHKREKEMVDAIPLATHLVLKLDDVEALSCLTWVLYYLGSNEDNKSHLKQALPALPRLVPWVGGADSPLALPALLSVGTMCTGYMRSLDYSGQVVEAGGVPAFLSYLRKGSETRRREMQMEALFALSNVAGGNNATVAALLDAGAFSEVMSLLRSAGSDEELRMECLYVLTNAWDPLVGAELTSVQQLLAAGILEEMDKQLDPAAPAPRLELLLKGLTDGLKRGQMVMTYTASMLLVEKGREAAAEAPPPTNPVVDLYGKLGTVDRIKALNAHSNAEVATKANGILTLLQFM